MKTLIFLVLLAAIPALAEDKPNTEKDCNQILQAFAQVQIKAEQSELVSDVKKAITVICRRSIDAEKKVAEVPAVEPTPEVQK